MMIRYFTFVLKYSLKILKNPSPAHCKAFVKTPKNYIVFLDVIIKDRLNLRNVNWFVGCQLTKELKAETCIYLRVPSRVKTNVSLKNGRKAEEGMEDCSSSLVSAVVRGAYLAHP